MKRTALVLLMFLAFCARPVAAQRGDANLTAQQRLGRQVLTQSCAVCHLPAGPNAKTYGPLLNKSTLPEEDSAIRDIILAGTGRMPAFKYFLQSAQIDAIISYLRTIPAPTATSAAPAQGKKDSDE